jgi:hypothetical protein
MPGRTHRGPCRRSSCLLYVEPLEDRQLLSVLHPAAGEYAGSHTRATGGYASTYSTPEYAHPAHTRAKTAGTYGQAFTDNGYGASAGSTPASADLTPNDAGSYAAQPAASSGASASSEAAVPGVSAGTLGAAAAVLPQSGRPDTGRPAAAPSATDQAPAAAGPVAAPGAQPGAGAAGGDAGRPAGEREPLPGAPRPAPTDDRPAAGRGIEVAGADAGEPLEPPAPAEVVPPNPALPPAGLLSGVAPVDLAALHRITDRFFERLEDLGRELPGGPLLRRLAPWVVTVSVATAGLELARWQMKKQSPRRPFRVRRSVPEEV